MSDKSYQPVSSSQYYKDILDEWPPFFREEELEFRRKMIAEGRYKEMKDELVLRNVGLISIYGKRWTRVYSPDDAVSIGITGLYEAAGVFDWTREDVRFGSFAGWYLKKAFNANKDKYQSQVDENSLRWDKTIDGDETDEGEGSCCLGDFVCGDIDPEYLALKNDPNDLCKFDVRSWMKEKIAAGFAARHRNVWRRELPEYDNAVLHKHIEAALIKLDNPDITGDMTAVELCKRIGGEPLSRERIRQMQVKNSFYLIQGIREELSERFKSVRPSFSDFSGAHTEKHNKLVWDPTTNKYDVVEVEERHACGTDWEKYYQAMSTFDRMIDMETDKYLTQMFHVKFKGFRPVSLGKKKTSKVERRYDFLAETANRHRAGSC